MRLSEFEKEVQRLGLTHSGEKRTIYVSEGVMHAPPYRSVLHMSPG